MDLYIQVGVLLLFLAALALFIYIYTAPAQQFTASINETNQEINDRLKTVEELGVAPFLNNTNAEGTSIYPLIRDAEASKMAILVQTKNQQGLIVNYGYQLRSANNPTVKMSPYGRSGVGNAQGTDFEQNFVTTVKEVFGADQAGAKTGKNVNSTSVSYGTSAMITGNVMDKVLPATGNVPGITPSGKYFTAPHLMLADPNAGSVAKAKEVGRTFSSTGFFYTDQVLKTDAPVNSNFSYADAQGSLYRFDQNASYYSTLILDANGDVVGIYVEEHGVNPQAAVLGSAMLANGTITSLY